MESHIELLPHTPEYKNVLYNALVKRDVSLLKSIKENFGQPIHLVKNWFYYALITRENENCFITIYDKEAIDQYDRFINSQKEDA
jgi:hypothetical protein